MDLYKWLVGYLIIGWQLLWGGGNGVGWLYDYLVSDFMASAALTI